MSNEKQINRRTFKEVVNKKLGELCERLDVQINRNLARADYYKKLGGGFELMARDLEAVANGLIDARHEIVGMGLEVSRGGDL